MKETLVLAKQITDFEDFTSKDVERLHPWAPDAQRLPEPANSRYHEKSVGSAGLIISEAITEA